jgi:DNA polymerase III delta subunit
MAELRARLSGTGEVPVDRFHGGEASLPQVANAAITVGLFHPQRLVVLGDADRCGRAGKRDQEALFSALGDLPQGSCFVAITSLSPREFSQKNVFARRLGEICTVLELAHPRPAEALRWILGQSKKLGIRLSPDAGELLLGKIGPDLQELARELEKLALWSEHGTTIDVDRLRALVRQGHLGSTWELCDSVLEGRTDDALRSWDAVRSVEPIPRLLWILQQRARDVLAKSRGGGDLVRLERLLLALEQLEHGIKSGRVPSVGEEVAFELALIESAGRSPVRPSAGTGTRRGA